MFVNSFLIFIAHLMPHNYTDTRKHRNSASCYEVWLELKTKKTRIRTFLCLSQQLCGAKTEVGSSTFKKFLGTLPQAPPSFSQ